MDGTVKFTHTTYNTEVVVFPGQVFGIMFLPSMKSVVLVGPGSTAIPVTDTIEEARKKITAALAAKDPQEGTDGISKRKRINKL